MLNPKNLKTFLLNTRGLDRTEIATLLGSGSGLYIEFKDMSNVPAEWEPPFIFYVNHVEVGLLDGDELMINPEAMLRTGNSMLLSHKLSLHTQEVN